MIYFILIYLILGVMFTYMHSGVISYVAHLDQHKINKKLLLALSYIWISLTFPKIIIYSILKLKTFEDRINKENK